MTDWKVPYLEIKIFLTYLTEPDYMHLKVESGRTDETEMVGVSGSGLKKEVVVEAFESC